MCSQHNACNFKESRSLLFKKMHFKRQKLMMENGKHGQSEVVQWLRAQSLSWLAHPMSQPVCPTDKMRRCCSVGFYSDDEYLALSPQWLRWVQSESWLAQPVCTTDKILTGILLARVSGVICRNLAQESWTASTMILILGLLLSVVSGQLMEGLVQLDKYSIDKVSQLESAWGT